MCVAWLGSDLVIQQQQKLAVHPGLPSANSTFLAPHSAGAVQLSTSGKPVLSQLSFAKEPLHVAEDSGGK